MYPIATTIAEPMPSISVITYVLPREFPEDSRPWPYSRRLKLLPGGKVKIAIKSSKKGFVGKVVLKSVSTVARSEIVGSGSIKAAPGRSGQSVLKLSPQAVRDVKAQRMAKFKALFVDSKSGKKTSQSLAVTSS